MLDINLFRENPQIIRDSQRARYKSVKIVKKIIKLDRRWTERKSELEDLQEDERKRKQEAKLVKAGGDGNGSAAKHKNKKLIAAKEKEVEIIKAALIEKLDKVGNLVHSSVPHYQFEDRNEVVGTWQKECVEPKPKNHVELIELLGIAALKDGGGGYYLLGKGVLLNRAIINYALDFLKRKGFRTLQIQQFSSQDLIRKLAEIAESAGELHKFAPAGEDMHLTPTAELPLCGQHLGDWLQPTVPIKYSALTSCIRKETGKQGRDTGGLGQLHQFEQVQQFLITSPNDDDSSKALEEMRRNLEEFYKNLQLPYRVKEVVSGALNEAEAKRYNLETWLPASNTYQIHGCSNCTDYHARMCGIRFGQQQANDQIKQYCHLLNSCLTESYMTMCCILENYQTAEGVRIPDVLEPWMLDGTTFMPFEKKEVKISKSKKQKTQKA